MFIYMSAQQDIGEDKIIRILTSFEHDRRFRKAIIIIIRNVDCASARYSLNEKQLLFLACAPLVCVMNRKTKYFFYLKLNKKKDP